VIPQNFFLAQFLSIVCNIANIRFSAHGPFDGAFQTGASICQVWVICRGNQCGLLLITHQIFSSPDGSDEEQ
jgi:hypothetical protein